MIRACTLFLLTLCCSFSAATAGIYGIVAGRVLDAEKQPIAGATVLVEGTKRGAYTKANGNFVIVKLLEGTYTIRVKSIGFNDYTTSITVISDQTTELDIFLSMSDRHTDTLVIRGTSLAENTVIGSVHSVSAERINAIPTSSIQGVIAHQPGVQTVKHPFNIRRGCTGETQFRIDGLDMNDQFSGAFGKTPSGYFPTTSNSDVENVQVLTGGMSGEYSNALSGTISTLAQGGLSPLFTSAEKDNLSTFAMDVDNASYTRARSMLSARQLPSPRAIRTEEFLNYFDYGYAPPCEDEFAIYMECAPSVFGAKNTKLLSIAIKARELFNDERRDASLTFVIDISGSMADDLVQVRQAMTELVQRLRPTDSVCIVTFGAEASVHLATTSAAEKEVLLRSIKNIRTTGSTNVGAGMKLGYECAVSSFDSSRINRVILIGDGVANNGLTSGDAIVGTVAASAERGIYLTVIGMGMGDYNDTLMEELANKGNGKYYYIDNEREMKHLFVYAQTGILDDVARDAKIQVEFDPLVVEQYRLLGYENRDIPDSLFRDDKQDAGEVGPGHTVIALYEIVVRPHAEGRIAKASIRYRTSETDEIREFQQSLSARDILPMYDNASYALKLANVVAQYAELLRGYTAPEHTFTTLLPYANSMVQLSGNAEEVRELYELIGKASTLTSGELAATK